MAWTTARSMTIAIPAVERPLVSVVMVTYGHWIWTQRALRALVNTTDPCYEVIIVDNASPDDTADRLHESLTGATVIHNDRNIGFGPASNQGANHARGRYLCFLNTDALVQPGWLPPLLASFDEWPEIAAVVPMLLNIDGTLQEAGCIVGSDGTTQSYGYGDRPEFPWYQFARIVDYGSAACMLVRRDAFFSVGGFDPIYAPAYGEDVDLCFSLRKAGWRTLYQPLARVAHARGTSAGPSEPLRAAHRRVFGVRWSDVLVHRPRIADLPRFPHRSSLAFRAAAGPAVLVLASEADDAYDIAAAIERVKAAYPRPQITLAVPHVSDDMPIREWARAGIEVVAGQVDWEFLASLRRHLYDRVVAMSPRAWGSFEDLLRRTQPQAVQETVGDFGVPGRKV